MSFSRKQHRVVGLFLASVLASMLFGAETLTGQEAASNPQLSNSALTIAPMEAAFVTTSLNLRESWEEFVKGSFVTELRQIPYILRVEAAIREKLASDDPGVAKAMALLRSPNGKNLLAVAQDMFSHESFVIGGSDWCEFADAFAELQAEITEAAGGGEEALKEFVTGLDKERINDIAFPTTIIGFRLTSDANARVFLDALEGMIRFGAGSVEQIKPFLEGLKRADLSNGQILSWSVGPDMIPWDQLPMDNIPEGQRELVDHLIEVLEDRQVTISLGIIDNRLMFALSEDAEVLKELGGSDVLVRHARLAGLLKDTPKKLRSISYISKDWREASFNLNFGNYFGNLAAQLSAGIKSGIGDGEKADEIVAKVVQDAQWIDEKLSEIGADADAALTYSFVTDEGLEGRTYDWSKNQLLANAKPLSIVRHAGSKPLILAAFKQIWPKQIGEIIDGIMDEIPVHVDRIIKSGLLDEEASVKVEALKDKIWPLVEEGYEIVRSKVCPSLDSRESLIAMAAQLTTTSLGDAAPEIDQPLPVPEIAGTAKLTDKDLFLSGCKDLLELMNKVVVVTRELNPDSIPESYSIPLPNEEQVSGGIRYFYNIPKEGLPISGIQLQVLVTKSTVTFGYSTRQVRDMAEDKPLTTRPAWMTSDSEVAAVGYVDLAGIFAAAKPWIGFALSSAAGDLEEPLQPEGDFPVPTGNDILRMWDCLHTLGKSAGTTIIDKSGVTVSRWIWVGE